MEEIVWEKTAEYFDLAENSNFIRETTKTVVRGCSGINLQENTRGGVVL